MLEIVRLNENVAAPAARVLGEAFADYPFLRRAFHQAKRTPTAMIQMMFDWAIAYRLRSGIPALVALKHGTVVGVATMRTTSDPPLPTMAEDGWNAIESEMHPNGIKLFEAYDRLQARLKPNPAPNYVVAIGVHIDHRDRGIGRGLIDEAMRLYPEAPLMLDTHDEANVRKYLAMGFTLHAEAEVLGTPNWYFLRAQRAESGKQRTEL